MKSPTIAISKNDGHYVVTSLNMDFRIFDNDKWDDAVIYIKREVDTPIEEEHWPNAHPWVKELLNIKDKKDETEQ